jgi:hypothetical protein
MHFCWLLAKNDLNLLQVAIGLIMFVVYAVNQIVNRDRKKQSPKSTRPVPRQLPPQEGSAKRPPSPGRPVTPQKSDPLLAEIQKFLKQSNPEKRSPVRSLPPGVKPVRVEPVGGKSVRVEPILVREVTVVPENLGRPLDSRHLDTTEFGTRASQMTDDLKRGDAEREQHFQQTFSHKLGRLTDTSVAGAKSIAPDAPTVSTVPVAPVPLSDWLPLPTTKPEDLRRAFMLNEILQRPEHRW